tara:strand:+ start:40866 stop:41216 length:351 start_codon:yes stop_codon:yes gene_type:complete
MIYMGERHILGLTEDIIVIGSEEKMLRARIDSGATSSSIDKQLVESLNLGPVIRMKLVKSASGVGERPIIEAEVKINGSIIKDEFTIADRSHMTYQILIGQNTLKKGQFLIDPLKE